MEAKGEAGKEAREEAGREAKKPKRGNVERSPQELHLWRNLIRPMEL